MKKTVIATLALATPFLVLAQEVLGGVTSIVDALPGIITTLTQVVVGLAVLVFFWGLVKYIKSANDPAEASKGKSIMIGGIVAIFVMASVWGIVAFLGDQFNLDDDAGADITIPDITN